MHKTALLSRHMQNLVMMQFPKFRKDIVRNAFQVGTTKEGRLTAIEADFYINVGCSQNESMEPLVGLTTDSGKK